MVAVDVFRLRGFSVLKSYNSPPYGGATPLANVFDAFRKGLDGTVAPAMSPAMSGPRAEQASGPESLPLLSVLQTLGRAPDGRLPFSAFAGLVPGDPVTTLAATVRMMKEGWVEFVGQVSESSDVRLTGQGQDLLATLAQYTAAA
jgi:hypothetical protein